jgi:hypothetical protein
MEDIIMEYLLIISNIMMIIGIIGTIITGSILLIGYYYQKRLKSKIKNK